MEINLFVCDECQKEIKKQERYPVNFDDLSGWIRVNGVIEYDYNHRILSGSFDFCSMNCFIKNITKSGKGVE